MKEHELNAIVGVVTDPINCVYDISNRKNLYEIQRIINVFNINKEQEELQKCFSGKSLMPFNLVLSNN